MQYPDVVATHYSWIQSLSWWLEACRAAEYMYAHHFPAHRGAVLWCPNVTAIFGNDGHDPDDGRQLTEGNLRARAEVERLRRKLVEAELEELAFGKSKGGYTWTVLVNSGDAYRLFELVWQCYPPGSSNNPWEKGTAFSRLTGYLNSPIKESCLKG